MDNKSLDIPAFLSKEVSTVEANQSMESVFNNELSVLYNRILHDLTLADPSGMGQMQESDLIDYLSRRIIGKKKLNVGLIRQLFESINHNENGTVELTEFVKEYILAHEDLKLNYETLTKGLNKEIKHQREIKEKIKSINNTHNTVGTAGSQGLRGSNTPPAPLNIQHNYLSTEIGKINLITKLIDTELFCKLSIDSINEKSTEVQKTDNLNFKKCFNFPLKNTSKESMLIYKLCNTENQTIAETDIPLYNITVDNEEVTPEIELKDLQNNTIAIFKPKIIVITSLLDLYYNQLDSTERIIQSHEQKLAELKQAITDISEPYKKEFEESEMRMRNYEKNKRKNGQNDVENNSEMCLFSVKGLKMTLYLCVFFDFVITLNKVDFINIVLYSIILFCLNTNMYNYLYKYKKYVNVGIGICIAYDFIDLLNLRYTSLKVIKKIDRYVNLFAFLSMIGKCLVYYIFQSVNNKTDEAPLDSYLGNDIILTEGKEFKERNEEELIKEFG